MLTENDDDDRLNAAIYAELPQASCDWQDGAGLWLVDARAGAGWA